MKKLIIGTLIIAFCSSNLAMADKGSDKNRLDDCWKDYKELDQEFRKANNYGPYAPTNAEPEVRRLHDRAESKNRKCYEIQMAYDKKYGVTKQKKK